MKKIFIILLIIISSLIASSCLTTGQNNRTAEVTLQQEKPVPAVEPAVNSETEKAESEASGSAPKPETVKPPSDTASAASTELPPEEPKVRFIDEERDRMLKEHARNLPGSLKSSPDELAARLAEVCDNDYEKAKILFIWIADNISYDVSSYFSRRYQPQNSESVLISGKAVCAGYSDVFKSIGTSMGLDVITITGHGKGYSYRKGKPITENHAWTGVRIYGELVLIDSTWGAGHLGGDRKYHKEYEEPWFDVDPEVMIFSHLPSDPSMQFTEKIWTAEEYTALPDLRPDVFSDEITPALIHRLLAESPADDLDEELEGLKVFRSMGFSLEGLINELLSLDFTGFPKIYTPPRGREINAIDMPISLVLTKGENYIFSFTAPDCEDYAMIYNRDWHFALRPGGRPGRLSGTYDGLINEEGIITFNIDCSRTGTIKITAQPEKGDSYGAFLEYRVR